MSVYCKKGSLVYTMDFQFQGSRIKESTGVRTITMARRVERDRRLGLEQGRTGLKKIEGPKLFQSTADTWLELKSATLSPNGHRIESTNLKHLASTFGKMFVNEIEVNDIAAYQKRRVAAGYANKTVNLEIGTLRSVLIYCGQWDRIQGSCDGGKVKTLKTRDDHGVALSSEQESLLLAACSVSHSRCLVPIVTVALYTGARFGVVRNLLWGNVDFARRELKFGKDKTTAGDNRTVPMGQRVIDSLKLWAENFPDRKPNHFVFPTERYGHVGQVYDTKPLKAIGSIKTAWGAAQVRSKVTCRIHDLRHTAVSRMLQGGIPFMQVAQIVGWSASNTVLMAKRYGHYSQSSLRNAMESIDLSWSPLKSHPSEAATPANLPN